MVKMNLKTFNQKELKFEIEIEFSSCHCPCNCVLCNQINPNEFLVILQSFKEKIPV